MFSFNQKRINKYKSEETLTKFANFISNITYSPLLSIPTFIAINYFFLNFHDFVVVISISIFFSAFLPMAFVLLWVKKKNSNVDMPKKEDRTYPLIIGLISSFIGASVLYLINAPFLTTILMFCLFSNTLIIFLINYIWKISIHSAGVAVYTTVLTFAFGYFGALFGLLIPLVMWSRLYLKKHTISQIIGGIFLGSIFTIVQIYAIMTFFYHMPSNIYPNLWLFGAFMVGPLSVSIAGILNKRGVKDGYTRKVFHFLAFASVAVFLKYALPNEFTILMIMGMLTGGLACLSGKDFLWLKGVARDSDQPHEVLYVVLPLICTFIWFSGGWKFFDRSIMVIATMCVAVGDAIAEPVGVRFGKHKYDVFSLTGKKSQRSLEGSSSVFIMCAIIIFLATNSLILALGVGIFISLIEGISPRGTDNLTVPIAASLALSIPLYI